MSELDNKNESENLSRIRDILFGEDLEGIEKKLAEFREANDIVLRDISANFSQKFSEIEKLFTEFTSGYKTEQSDMIGKQDTINNEILLKIDDINKEFQKEKENYNNLLKENTNELSNQITRLEESIKEQLSNHIKSTESVIKSMEDKMISKDVLSNILKEIADKINESK